MPTFWFVLAVLAILIFAILVTAWIFSGIVLYSRRQPIVVNPQAYDLPFENVSFASSDGLQIKGWFIPAPDGSSEKVILVTHPMPMNRHGFLVKNQGFPPLFKTDVDLLQTIRALQQAGYAVLTFDLRNHGESQRGLTGNGLTEYQDVLGAVEYLRHRPELNVRRIGFVCFCMGASATMAALSKGKDQLKLARFLVAIQPVSASVFFRNYLRDVYTPLSLFLLPIVDWLVQHRGGFPLAAMSPAPFAADIEIPTLYIQSRDDPWTEFSDIQGFYDATPAQKEIWWLEGLPNRFDAYNYVGQSPERILAFIEEHFH